MAHVFISYSRKDSAFVDKIEAELNQRGIETWRDKHNIPGGMAWYQAIVAGLDSAYAMICVVSPNADESRWVLREQLYADDRRIACLPVLEKPHKIPFIMQETQPIHCADATFSIGMGQLVAVLRPLQAAAPSQPTGVALKGADEALDTDRLREEYLRFLLAETVADLRDALYVNLTASAEQTRPEAKAKSALSFGLGMNMDMLFDLKQLGLEAIKGENFEAHGDEVQDARQPIRDYQRVVLLGEPGAGKTTTLLKLVVDYARTAQADSTAMMPVFVPLREFTGEQPFADFVRQKLGLLQEAFGAFRLFFLLDALNEMPRQAADGRDLVAEVRDFLRDKADWVVSCRVRDYQDDLSSLSGLGKVRIKPLDVPQIREFITRFYAHTPGLTDAQQGDKLWHSMKGSDHLLAAWTTLHEQGQADAFWGVTYPDSLGAEWRDMGRAWNTMHHDSRRMMHLGRNPYLLTMVCVLFGKAGQLPAKRGALFQQFVGLLLKREEDSAAHIGAAWLDSARIRQGLAQVAYAMGSQTEMPRIEAERILKQHLPDTNSDLLLRLAIAASLIDVGVEVRFTHQLLQEYFASEVLGALFDAQTDPQTLWKPDSWWQANGREETVIILAGVRGDAEGIARWLAPAQPELAYQVLTDSGVTVDLKALDDLTRTALMAAAKQKTSEPNPVGRAAAYRVLGLLNADHRAGVGLTADGLPDMDWVDIPDDGEWIYQDDKHKPLPAFKIARYPVTYAQFQAFVEDASPQGYGCDEWWEGLAASAADREMQEQAFKYGNHPRECVNWYQAVAFCRWLSSKLGYRVTLPTEEQWEKAARGREGRIYPYGETFEASKCNSSVDGAGRIGMTSAVGLFADGHSPYGVADMSGNVWEWCLNKYETPEDTGLNGTDVRVLRGGSWDFSGSDYFRCDSRGWNNPNDGFSFDGLRVSRS